jgi:N-acetylmuramidase-like protein/SH3 domain-containing protein
MANMMGTATTAVKLRTGPGADKPVLAFVLPNTRLEVLGAQDDWLQVRVGGKEGYVGRSFVLLDGQGVGDGFLKDKVDQPATPASATAAPPATAPAPSAAPALPAGPSLTGVPLEAPASERLPVNPKAPLLERLAADIWNRYGGLLSVLSAELKIDPGVAVAVLAVESGGRGFGPDGRMLIRFENQVFFDQWGTNHPDVYNQHFTFDPARRWGSHKWRPSPDQAWWPENLADFHGDQGREWTVFNFARTLDDAAAKKSISMGGPQIMGFNFAACGYESVQQMFDAFSASERNQVIGFFDFVQGPSTNSRRVLALQGQDFNTFASMYNGPGQAAKYGGLIKSAFDAFHQLLIAAPHVGTVESAVSPPPEVAAPAPVSFGIPATPEAAAPAPAPAPAVAASSLNDVPLEPPADQKIPIPPTMTNGRRVATIWNKYGGLIRAGAAELGIDPATLVAVLGIESGGVMFINGRLSIRFENHIFFGQWGKNHPDVFNQHFQFNPAQNWTGHQWRPALDQPWRAQHTGDPNEEWLSFNFACTLDDTVAKLSISMGGPQIMGFNYRMLGYPSVQALFDDFSKGERNQVMALINFIRVSPNRIHALQTGDTTAFAREYNGPARPEQYGNLIKGELATFHALKPA